LFTPNSKELIPRIQSLADEYGSQYIDIRRHLHAHPELSYQEFETSKLVREHLNTLGIPNTVIAGTGVVGLIEGHSPSSRVVALRADMDALPIQEENDIPYKSTQPGIMHACGHDVHTSCLLGAARILQELRQHWAGTVKLIFQPGEEKNPGGASLMIKEGVLENPRPQRIFGMHVHTGLATGRFSFREGMVMASADEIYLTIKSKGGHAAAPHLTADPIMIGSQLVVALQQIVSRNNNPFNPSVLSITAFQGGNTTNVIPSEVRMMGTFRAMNESWRFEAHDQIISLATRLVESMGATIDIRIDVGYPFVLNDGPLTAAARQAAEAYVGVANVEETELRMGAEDFAFYSHQIPGCFFRLGTCNPAKGASAGVHTPTFNIDEAAIPKGIGMMALLGATGGEGFD